MNVVLLGGTAVGEGQPPYVIAEIGSNHNGDMELCRRMIEEAAAAGADAVKFQSWSESSLIAKEEYDRNPEYPDKKRHFGSLREMVRAYQLTPSQHAQAARWCLANGVAFCSSVFSPKEADLLESLDTPFYKLASMDVTNLPLLAYVASKRRPIVMSTGMATLAEIDRGVETIRAEGNQEIVLLHCVSIYPPPCESMNLRNMEMLRQTFAVPVGFSDHTLGTSIPLAAVALGACLIEKHFTLDKDMAGWDHSISADSHELRTIVTEGRKVYASLGTYERGVTEAEMEKRLTFRRSLVATRPLERGEVIAAADLDVKRPGTGIAPDEIRYVVGRRVARDIGEDQLIGWNDLE